MQKDSVWVDTRDRPALPVVRVQPYTPAYFALLDAIPELRALFAVGERVRVSGRTIAIEVTPAGVERLTDAEVARVRAGW